MENVVAFNNELSGLYDSKPPISKAKMAAITKSAMRAIKFYKHVVQSVEKFILKCKPEYKVPGLYVIDSIVRQSRHQFGAEKDVFAPRFARNVKETFANLFRCAPEDKSRIIRVLNLWQKNNVFAPEVIQPIFDLADPNHPIYQMQPIMGPSGSGSGIGDMSLNNTNGMNATSSSMDIGMGNVSSMSGTGGVGGSGGGDEKIGLPDLSSMSHEKAQNVIDNSTLRQLEHMQQYLKRQTGSTASATVSKSRENHAHNASYGFLIDSAGGGSGVGVGSGNVGGATGGSSSKMHHMEGHFKYSKNTHELGYGDDDIGHGEKSPQHASNMLDNNNLKQLLNDPNVLLQLQTLQNFQKFKQQEDKQSKLNEMRLQEEAFEKHLQNVLKASTVAGNVGQDANEFNNKEVEFISQEQKIEVINLDGNDSRSPTPERDRFKRRRSRSRSRDRLGGGGGGGGASGRGDRRRRNSRSRSRSRDRDRRRSSRDRERERNERNERNDRSMRDKERDRERRRKGLPDVRKEHLSVCTTTLWVGHISKLVYQEELSDTFGEYGDIVTIDQIVPRGCAFIVMNRRQDAYKAMQGLKNHKLQGRTLMISWASGKGVKSKEWNDFWDLDLGVTYIPWNKLNEQTDIDALEEGGMFDEDSMPSWMKDKINRSKNLKEKSFTEPSSSNNTNSMLFNIDTTQPPPRPPAPGPPIMSMMPGQFSMAPPMSAPQRMLGPMSMSLSGIPMPPNLVPGMPPPHMMLPTGMMPPGFPPIPNQVGASAGPAMGPSHLGLAPGVPQFHPPPNSAVATPVVPANLTSDDQMDMEMDDDDAPASTSTNAASQMNFSHPPPIFAAVLNAATECANEAAASSSSEMFSRDRNRAPGGPSRWSGSAHVGGGGGEEESVDMPPRWRENGAGGGPPNFNDNRGGIGRMGGPMNMSPMDFNNQPQRPDFMNDFDNRGGGQRGGPPRGLGNQNGDFFPPNMQNRFNQPTSLMQMRIPPPNPFNNPHMGGPPMFMRGQGGMGQGQGGPNQGRQQGPGFFNPRNPFDRDIGTRGRGRGRGGRGSRDGAVIGGGGGSNWSDDDSGLVVASEDFKRRANRFREHDGPDDRRGGGGRRNDRGGGQRDRFERDFHDGERDRGIGARVETGNSRNSREDNRIAAEIEIVPVEASPIIERIPVQSAPNDTEDDWDRELEEYDARMAQQQTTDKIEEQPISSNTAEHIEENTNLDEDLKWKEAIDTYKQKQNANSSSNNNNNNNNDNTETKLQANVKIKEMPAAASTPLYDELPPPVSTAPAIEPVKTDTTVETSDNASEPAVVEADATA